MAARAALLLAALALGGWLLLAYGGARDERRAVAATDARRAAALYDAARRRRPDGTVVPRRAGLLLQLGRAEEAARLARSTVRDEPENITAWTVLALALARSDPAAARAADARRRALAPRPGS